MQLPASNDRGINICLGKTLKTGLQMSENAEYNENYLENKQLNLLLNAFINGFYPEFKGIAQALPKGRQ